MSLPTFAAAFRKNSKKRQRYMKKIMFLAMLVASVAVIVSCSKDDPFTEAENYGGNSWNPGNGSGTPGSNGSSATTGELATFDISLDAMSAEPTEASAEYFPQPKSPSTCRTLRLGRRTVWRCRSTVVM